MSLCASCRAQNTPGKRNRDFTTMERDCFSDGGWGGGGEVDFRMLPLEIFKAVLYFGK